MKKLIILLGIASVITACTTIDQQQDIQNAEASIKGFYTAVVDFNYDELPEFCTDEFSAFEEGFDFGTIDGYINTLKSMEGMAIDIDLNFVKTEIVGDIAHSIVEFDASFTKGAVMIAFQTYENYILKRVNNKWLLHYCHSTHLADPDDKAYSSIHLMKISEELPLSGLEEVVGKFNEAIASIGYMDCGYKIMPVVPGSNEHYNYVMKGNWKNQETYDVIHEHESYTNVHKALPESLNGYFKDQIYVKAHNKE
ncbi:nuclear transport factor 2 family protein [Carboxylicivirga marina]|uniref:Nuclear transport factor 2 family protein n=1 Tax=Carboxylicivirga marina TaxID=2800988 RepID=A0ABS1HF72_9BACT|nr:nuclear transport factor 2 family protein [Carboxylicivirga marina]MBK3516120.1 nuclear transport factor 2 family protein [Carboxylicivirga marina]